MNKENGAVLNRPQQDFAAAGQRQQFMGMQPHSIEQYDVHDYAVDARAIGAQPVIPEAFYAVAEPRATGEPITIVDFGARFEPKKNASFHQWKEEYDKKREQGEATERTHGAFIQVLAKHGNNISYVSYGLPLGVDAKMLEQMMTGVLYPEDMYQGSVQTEKVDNGDLQLIARSGLGLDALDRLALVPQQVLSRGGQFDRDSNSAKKFFGEQAARENEFPQRQREFLSYLFSDTPQAKVADGVKLHHGAYRFENNTVIGLDITGENEFDLLHLAKDPGHQELMEKLVAVFENNEDVVVVLADKSRTVGDCDQACADYFDWKELGADVRNLGFFDRNFVAPAFLEHAGSYFELCPDHGMSKEECGCKNKKTRQLLKATA